MSRWFVNLCGGATTPSRAWAGVCVCGVCGGAEWVLCSIVLKNILL